MDGLVIAVHPGAGFHSYKACPARGKALNRPEKLHLKRFGSISLLPPLAKGNFHARRLHAFWRNAADRADLRRCGWSNAAGTARKVSRRELPLMLQSPPSSIESKASWTVATVASRC